VTAGAIAEWYFSDWKMDASGNRTQSKMRGSGTALSNWPTFNSCKRACCKHLGSVAFGSLIIAIIQFIRYCIMYMEAQLKGEPKTCVNIQKSCHCATFKSKLLCCIKCCLRCVECCLDKISKAGYVWIAIWGDNFVVAACSATGFLLSNILRTAAITVIGQYLLLLGKLSIAFATTGLAALLISGWKADEVNSFVMPCVVVFILSYMIASLFMIIFETTIDCVFICFLIDERQNKGKDTRMMAPKVLEDLVDKHKGTMTKAAQQYKDFRKDGGVASGPAGSDSKGVGAAAATAPAPAEGAAAGSGGHDWSGDQKVE
jgi:hypothetical protein